MRYPPQAALVAGFLLFQHLAATAVDPLTIAAAGVATSLVLDKAEAKAQQLINGAAGAASLVVSKAARDAELLIGAARAQLHDELAANWDSLDRQKLSILREVDYSIQRAEKLAAAGARLEDAVVLDIGAIVDRLPFASASPFIRRVEGASQYYKPSGTYRVVVTTNLVQLAKGDITARVNGAVLPVVSMPPHGLAINVPVATLNKLFDAKEQRLVYVPIEISARTPADRSWYQFWKPSEAPTKMAFKLELFPRHAVTYILREWTAQPAVDDTRRLTKQGGDVTIPGCGNDGCNAYHPVCVSVPEGAQPIAAKEHRDSFSGWGGWGPATISGTQVCATYWQHSHNQPRNVGFNVEYFPATQTQSAKAAQMERLDVGETGSLASTIDIGSTYSARFSPTYVSYDLIVKTFTGETYVATPGFAPPAGGILKVSPLETGGTFRRVIVSFQLPW